MMVPNDGENQAERFERRANSFANYRMLSHDYPFLLGQSTRFKENGIRNRDFPDVVDNARTM